MSRSAALARGPRAALVTLMAFLFGIPAGVVLLWWVGAPPKEMPENPSDWQLAQRYLNGHPVEQAEVILFCCAVGFLLGKALVYLKERAALSWQMLPAWDGTQVPARQAKELADEFAQRPGLVRNSLLGARVANVLDFVQSRASANELDDQLRTLADNDALAQEGGYSLLRFITWAIPILGFLGTVLGITGAISGVTPEVLEKSLSKVTEGLATAFDTTALALFLTMILMFWTFLSERMEQTILDQVDRYVDAELAHRFERTGPESSQFVEALRQNTQILLRATEQLVEKQAHVWARSLEKADRMWNETGQHQLQQVTAALNDAIEKSLTRHADHLDLLEAKMQERSQHLVDGISRIAEALARQADVLAKLQDGEAQLLRLQDNLNQNLTALTSTGTFEQAVQSLTAAIHLLTTRVSQGSPVTGPRLARPA